MLLGADVSKYQSFSDYKVFEEARLAFAYIKASQGITGVDPKLVTHSRGIDETYLCKGFYHYFIGKDDAKLQAQHFCNTIAPYYDNYTLPPVVDFEDPGLGLSPQQAHDALMTFLQAVETLIGVMPMIYTIKSFATTKVANLADFGKYPLWDSAPGEAPRTPYGSWSQPLFWQNSFTGQLNGVIDTDRFFGDAHRLGSFINSTTFKGGLSSADWVTQNNIAVF